jgi:quercetin dioxygenase-like cupin family protein
MARQSGRRQRQCENNSAGAENKYAHASIPDTFQHRRVDQPLRALHQLLVAPAEASGAFGIFRMIVPPGVAIPLHSHADPEVFDVLEGTGEFLQYEGDSSRWLTANSGDPICAPSDVKHAFRNSSSAPVTYLVASTPNAYNFFNELKESFHPDPSAGSPTPEEMQRLLTLVANYNYWVASPEENAAIGLTGF